MNVFLKSLKTLYIDWQLQGDTFSVYRSTSPDDGFVLLQENITQPFYEDSAVNLYDEDVRYYYRIEGYNSLGNQVSSDGPKTWLYHRRDPIAHKVMIESDIVLRVMDNPSVFLLMRHRVGEPCPDCWNSITQKIQYANCPTCNGTGYKRGYHEPIASRISRDVSQLTLASGEEDGLKTKLNPIRAWIPNTPLVHPEDIVITATNQRYKIVNVAQRTKSEFVIRQILDLAPLEKGHPAYQVEVNREVLFH